MKRIEVINREFYLLLNHCPLMLHRI
jgi:hypothetical protein